MNREETGTRSRQCKHVLVIIAYLSVSIHGGVSEDLNGYHGYIIELKKEMTSEQSEQDMMSLALRDVTKMAGVDVIRELHVGTFRALHVEVADVETLTVLRGKSYVQRVSINSRLRGHPLEKTPRMESVGGAAVHGEHSTAPLASDETKQHPIDSSSPFPPANDTAETVSPTPDPPGATEDYQSECIDQRTGYDVWGLSRIGARAPPDYATATFRHTNANRDTDLQYPEVIIYVMDTGVYTEHDEFQGRAAWGYTVDGLLEEGDTDLSGHGTFVAGVAGGASYGVAKTVRLVAVKVLDENATGWVSDAVEGIEWTVNNYTSEVNASSGATHGVAILALGGFGFIYSLEVAIQAATDAGLAFVVSAGNYAMDTCFMSPARMSSVVSVASVDVHDQLASSSNYGPCVDILAPGEDIPSAFIGHPAATARRSGTSIAAPHVAGAMANALARENRVISPAMMKALLLDSSSVGFIELFEEGRESTPNRLVYAECTEAYGETTVQEAYTTADNGQVDGGCAAYASRTLLLGLLLVVRELI